MVQTAVRADAEIVRARALPSSWVLAHSAMGRKRAVADGSNAASPKKNMRVSEVPDLAMMGPLTKTNANQKWPTDECIHIVLMKYMDNCSAYGETVSEKKMYVLQMATNRRPSPLYQFTKLVEIHGASEAGQMEKSPCSLKEVEQRYKAKHQFVGKKNDRRG